jgi:DNA end-binding protein Ku
LYSATQPGAGIEFKLLDKGGGRLKQQYVNAETKKLVERADMVKGYEFEKDHFVLFTPAELKALEEGSSHVVQIITFVPLASIDPIFYDKAYLLAPDKRGEKPYELLAEALRVSGRCALAKWSWKAKQSVVQIRATEDGLILQQLRYAHEVRSLRELELPHQDVSKSELQLALQLVDQIAADSYEPHEFHDEEQERVLAEIEKKIKGKQIVSAPAPEGQAAQGGGQVLDLMEALKASLASKPPVKSDKSKPLAKVTQLLPKLSTGRKPAKRAATATSAAKAEAPKARARR